MTDTSDRLAEIRARLDAAKGISPGTNLAEKFGLAVSAGYAIRDNAADDLAFLLELVDQLQGQLDEARAENARLAAQDRASGPETSQGHPK